MTFLTYDKITHIVDEFIFKSAADVTVDFNMWQANPFQEERFRLELGSYRVILHGIQNYC